MPGSIDIFSAAASADDAEVRHQGIGFLDSSISGYALLMGDDAAAAPAIIESLAQRQVVVFITEDMLFAALQEAGQPLGWNFGIVPLDLPHALGFIARMAQVYSNADGPEDALRYARQRLLGFTLLLGEPTSERLILAQAATPLGCPLLSNAELPSSVETWEISAEYRAAIGGVDLSDIVQMGIEERGLQIHVPIPELPVAYSPDFSG